MKSYNGFSPSQRMNAYRWLKSSGRPMSGVCEACGNPNGAPHSEDYSEPYGDHIGAYMLCLPCHMFVHCRFRIPEAWAIYRKSIRGGKKWSPAPPHWFAFRSMVWGGADIPFVKHGPASPKTVLDDIEEQRLRTRWTLMLLS